MNYFVRSTRFAVLQSVSDTDKSSSSIKQIYLGLMHALSVSVFPLLS
jgi:hypothetical protein